MAIIIESYVLGTPRVNANLAAMRGVINSGEVIVQTGSILVYATGTFDGYVAGPTNQLRYFMPQSTALMDGRVVIEHNGSETHLHYQNQYAASPYPFRTDLAAREYRCLHYNMHCQSPIIFDFGPNGYDLTGLDNPILFDMDGDGIAEQLSWTTKASRDAFLVLDRNGNNMVDDGTELFGTGTRLSSGEFAEHGYIALAELDLAANGGNADGLIDGRDVRYWDLQLWTDLNRNGKSEYHELTPLHRRGIVAIGLDFEVGTEFDEHGNWFGFSGSAYRIRGRRIEEIATTDVFFLSSSSE